MISALDPRVLLVAIVAVIGATFGGYQWGSSAERKANEATQNKALAAALQRARTAEGKLAKDVQGVSNEYEAKLSALGSRYAAVSAELGRLRVKPRCASLPTNAASPGQSDATAESGTVGAGTGEINLDDIARKIIELGRDYDAANAQVSELQSLVRKYENACKID